MPVKCDKVIRTSQGGRHSFILIILLKTMRTLRSGFSCSLLAVVILPLKGGENGLTPVNKCQSLE